MAQAFDINNFFYKGDRQNGIKVFNQKRKDRQSRMELS